MLSIKKATGGLVISKLSFIRKDTMDRPDVPATKSIPLWVTIVAGLIALMGIFVGCSLYLTPGTFIKIVDFATPGTRYLANMWAARQIAIAGIIGYSLIRKSVPMLTVSLLAYCVMNVQDAAIGISISDNGLIIGATFVCLLSASMIYVISQK